MHGFSSSDVVDRLLVIIWIFRENTLKHEILYYSYITKMNFKSLFELVS